MTDLLFIIRVALDTGILVLIWLVQLVIYPSLTYYQFVDLQRWHRLYTRRVSYIVLPLMTGQLALYFYLIYTKPTIANWLSLILIIGAWGITFLKAVPLHGAIEQASDNEPCHQLLATNRSRVVLWTAVWGITLYTLCRA